MFVIYHMQLFVVIGATNINTWRRNWKSTWPPGESNYNSGVQWMNLDKKVLRRQSTPGTIPTIWSSLRTLNFFQCFLFTQSLPNDVPLQTLYKPKNKSNRDPPISNSSNFHGMLVGMVARPWHVGAFGCLQFKSSHQPWIRFHPQSKIKGSLQPFKVSRGPQVAL